VAFVTLGAGVAPLAAQQPGVRVGLSYDARAGRPGILVLPVTGTGGDSVRAILARDLDFGDRVTVLPPSATLGAPRPGAPLNYALARRLGAAGIVQATLRGTALEVVLHDAGQGTVVERTTVTLPAATYAPAWRRAVHVASDQVEEWIAGVRGIAASRIAYSMGGRIWVIDSDGANATAITGTGALSPSWHPLGEQIAYAELEATGSAIRVVDLRGGTRTIVEPRGLNISPAFSPDGTGIAYAHGEDVGTDLWLAPAGGGRGARIALGRGSDNTSPSFSPDGRRMAFTSGRAGHPDVYLADADGTNVDVLTLQSSGGATYRASPDWSPDGRAVAFQSRVDGRFQVLVATLRDRSVQKVTAEGANEDPSWAADARHLVVSSTRSGARQLWVVDTETGRARQLTRTAGARLPAWSPRLGR
jgi:TolB protein